MSRLRPRNDQRGFTLVELMVVVVIVGVLATLATFAVRKYILSAKTSEAVSLITSIKAAQESFKSETFQYLDVSQGNYENLYPTGAPVANKKFMWGGGTGAVADNWRTLGVQTDSPVQFGYASVAVAAGQSLSEPPTAKKFGFTAGSEPAYAVVAKGDLDGDGKFSYVVSHSFNAELYVENEGE